MRRLLPFVVLFAAGCVDREPEAPASAPEPAPEAVRTARPGVPLDDLLAPRDDDGPLVEHLRAPRTERARAEPNRYVEGQVDTVRTYVYDGLTIEAYEIAGGRTFIQRVTVTGSGYGTAAGVATDALRTDVEAALGPPVRETSGGVVYTTGDAMTPTTVTVVYEPDERGHPRASEITWRPYLD